MSLINPKHLFQQADNLASPSSGAPRQADLRRAVSSAYYGVFHAVLTTFADHFHGRSKRGTKSYTLAYRSVAHSDILGLCKEVTKSTLSQKYAPYAPFQNPNPRFSRNIVQFSTAFIDLQQQRHSADYDVSVKFRAADASLLISTARQSVRRWNRANLRSREAFLTLLAFPPR